MGLHDKTARRLVLLFALRMAHKTPEVPWYTVRLLQVVFVFDTLFVMVVQYTMTQSLLN